MKSGTINGITLDGDQCAITDFMGINQPIPINWPHYQSYREAIDSMAGKYYPKSFHPYFEAVIGETPDDNTWLNLIYLGHTYGHYDHDQKRYVSAREKGMEPSTDVQVAYLNALIETYRTITHFTPNA